MGRTLFLGLLFLMLSSSTLFAQRTLMLEQMIEVRPLKIYEGQTIWVKRKTIKEWTKVKIEKLMEAEDVILTDNGMIHKDEITHVRFPREFVRFLSKALKVAASGVLVSGGLGALSSNPVSIVGVITLSATSYGLGWLIKKIWEYKVYKIGKKNRLRIIDLTLPSPSDVNRL